MKHFTLTYIFYNGALPKQYECYAKSEKDARRQCQKALDITDSKIIKVESEEENE